MLTDGFDDIESQPFTSSGFADVYKATYKGKPVVTKALKITSVDGPESTHKVSDAMFFKAVHPTCVKF